MKKYLTIDLAKTKLKYAIITDELDVLQSGSEYITNEKQEDLFPVYKMLADRFRDEVEGMCISLPGVIDMKTGFAYSGGIFRWVHDFPYAEEVSKLCDMKVAVCNDAKAAAMAEIGYGSLKKIEDGVLMLLLGTGIGGAIMLDGKLLNGYHFGAGEFSYIMGDYQNRDQGKDMFATAVSFDTLSDLVSQACGKQMNVMKILAALSNNDEVVLPIVQAWCRRIAVIIYNIQCVVDVQTFVLGGNITDEPTMMELIQEAVDEVFANANYQRIRKPVISTVTFHDNAKLYGDVYHYRQLFEGKSNEIL